VKSNACVHGCGATQCSLLPHMLRRQHNDNNNDNNNNSSSSRW